MPKGKRMALIDDDKPLIPLSSIADLLNTKQRTLKMYEDKGLLPRHGGNVKKLYSINDVKRIAFVHYLASVERINANGIRFINEMFSKHVDEERFREVLSRYEVSLEKTPEKDIHEVEHF